MKHFLTVLLLLATVTFCASDNPGNSFDYDEEVPPGDSTQSGELIWSDEFNTGTTPNSNYWTYDIGHGSSGWGNNEVQYYTDQSKNVRLEDGKLIIEALKENGDWTSARIKTQELKTFEHVTVKARAKLPKGSGTWPAIWMLGADITEVGWPACGEIDIMEHVGKDPGVVHSALHTPSSHGNTQNTGEKAVNDFNSAFHIYEVEWTSKKMTFKIDGEEFYSYSPSIKDDQTWPYNDEFFIIMNIAMGGNWGSDPQYETDGLKNGIDPNISKARMEVDYIRVYKN
ncbi:glycoside hydrolase family 16 protein [Fodinibius saliphilus]|uniref:glycoside hydrolase family 16 protein n=1 Tax=Fodinibius saliphilus TaxID=1920650 RepID=UPI0014872E33|nr:glycoside hydrolase family 16 protein [Fodinibius saliphilus]